MDVVQILMMSGSLPVNELMFRSSVPTRDLLKELNVLQSRGLVEFDGSLPAADKAIGAETQIRFDAGGASAGACLIRHSPAWRVSSRHRWHWLFWSVG